MIKKWQQAACCLAVARRTVPGQRANGSVFCKKPKERIRIGRAMRSVIACVAGKMILE
jgi:hypothetical protein